MSEKRMQNVFCKIVSCHNFTGYGSTRSSVLDQAILFKDVPLTFEHPGAIYKTTGYSQTSQ